MARGLMGEHYAMAHSTWTILSIHIATCSMLFDAVYKATHCLCCIGPFASD